MFIQNRLQTIFLLLFSAYFLLIGNIPLYAQTTSCEEFDINIPVFADSWTTAPCIADGILEIQTINGTAPFTYLWSNGDTTAIADSLATGIQYSVTVTDANNCETTQDNISVPSEPTPPQPGILLETNGPEITFTAIGPAKLFDLIVAYNWKIESIPNAPSVPSFTHIFTEPDVYQMGLELTDICGRIYNGFGVAYTEVSPEEAFTFDIGGAEGLAGDTISLPVSVRNFKNISGFQKSIHLLNDQTGKIIGFHDFNLAGLDAENFEQKGDDLWSMVWFQQDPITLPDDSIIYYIDVLLTNTEGECTKVTFDSSDIPLQVATSDGTNPPTSIPSPWVRTSETCVANTVSLGGHINTPYGQPIEGVTIVNSGAADLLTNEAGEFVIPNLSRNQSYSLNPEKLEADLNDLTTLDLILILKHILNREPFNSPYKLVAADVNNDRAITVLDLITLQQFILNKIPELPAGNWIFLPKTFQFPTNGNILSTSFPREITTTELSEDQLEYDFIGIRVGDVSYDIQGR